MYLSTDHVYGDIFLSPSFLLSIMVSFPFQVPLLLIYNFALMNRYSSLVTQASFTLRMDPCKETRFHLCL